MRTRPTLGILIPLLLASCAAEAPAPLRSEKAARHVATTGPGTPEAERRGFHLPPGFEIQLVAAEPEIQKPMNLAFDERGRLWVTTSVEYPFPAEPGRGRDRVIILDEFGPDGRAGRATCFADGLNIPIGILPLSPNEALAYSTPEICRLVDSDEDGHADRREVVYPGFGFEDTHGMTNAFSMGLDGWVYACHGAVNESTVRGTDGEAIAMISGNVYRMRPDGSRVEWHTHGQVNPFGLALDPFGNFYSCDSQTRPIHQLLRGACYPDRPHDGLGYGPAMMSHDHGSSGIAGIAYYAADHFPAEFRDTIFVGNVVTGRINHDRLEWLGSTPAAIEQPDFLVSDDPWFRPVDIELGPDGALYIADFYNRIIGHYEVPLGDPGRDRERGRIWRIVYRGEDGRGGPAAPRRAGTRATTGELVRELAHPNLAVRLGATHQLATRAGGDVTPAVLEAMASAGSPEARRHGLWVLERRRALDDRLLLSCASDSDAGVRVHALRVLGERATLGPALAGVLVDRLGDPDARARRAAAEALGRHPSAGHLRALLRLLRTAPAEDTHLIHVARMALRDQVHALAARGNLEPTSWAPEDALALADVAVGVPTPEAAAFLLGLLDRLPASSGLPDACAQHVARYSGGSIESLVGLASRRASADLRRQAELLRAIARGCAGRGAPPSPPMRAWAAGLARKLMTSPDANDAAMAIDLAGSLGIEEMRESIRDLASDPAQPGAPREAAVRALVAIGHPDAVATIGAILGGAAEPLTLRELAADALAQLGEATAHSEAVRHLAQAPAPLQARIAAGLAETEEGIARLLGAIERGEVPAHLLQEPAIAPRLRDLVDASLRERIAKVIEGLPPADDGLRALLDRHRADFASATPDPEHGERVFAAHCASCHQYRGEGTRIGPQLDGIGSRDPDRLLQDILDPNRDVDRAYRVTSLALAGGRVVSGLLLREEGAQLVLADLRGREMPVPRAEVIERKVSPLSPMPSNFADHLAGGDLYDLVGYLRKK